MNQLYKTRIKNLHPIRKAAAYGWLGHFGILILVLYLIFTNSWFSTVNVEYLFILNFEYIIQVMLLMQGYFLSLEDPNRGGQRQKPFQIVKHYIKDDSTQTDRLMVLQIYTFLGALILNFVYFSNPIFWILREVILVLICIRVIREASKSEYLSSLTENFGSSLSNRSFVKYPLALLVVEIIRSGIVIAIIAFFPLSNSHYLMTIRVLGIGFLAMIFWIVIMFLESEFEKYLEFKEYQQNFREVENYQPHSFTGFMASIPEELGRSKYYINLIFAVLVAFGILFYIGFTYFANTGYDPVLTPVFVVIVVLVGLIAVSSSKTRDQVNKMMYQYTLVMNQFVSQNQDLFAVLDDQDLAEDN